MTKETTEVAMNKLSMSANSEMQVVLSAEESRAIANAIHEMAYIIQTLQEGRS